MFNLLYVMLFWKGGDEVRYFYMRLSTQDKGNFSRQEKYARDHNIPVENWYKERASGAKDNRQELNKLLATLKESDELYVTDASRSI